MFHPRNLAKQFMRLSVSHDKGSVILGEQRGKLDVFLEQVTDSAIVGGIAGISAYVASGADSSLTVFLIAFGLTFLLKLKEYRKIT